MSNSPGKYGNVREFLDNLGNEKIKICKNCNAVFSYQNETTVLCISCDFEEEVSTLPAVVEIEDEFQIAEAEPAVLPVQPTILQAEPVVAEVDIVESAISNQ
jgi:RNA polymerase subunit RPABC4/transcription elongation factor Spt4